MLSPTPPELLERQPERAMTRTSDGRFQQFDESRWWDVFAAAMVTAEVVIRHLQENPTVGLSIEVTAEH